MANHLVEITLHQSRVAAALGTLSYTLIVQRKSIRLYRQFVIQHPSRDVIDELEILVEVIFRMRVSFCECVDDARNILLRCWRESHSHTLDSSRRLVRHHLQILLAPP